MGKFTRRLQYRNFEIRSNENIGNRSVPREWKERKKGGGDRITFIYSLYHDHSIKRSVSSRDDRSSRSQHPHVVGRSPFVVIVEVVSGSQRDSNLRGSGIPTISHVPRFTYISIFPVSSPFVHRFFSPFLPSFLSLFFSRSFSK